mmetsp:Transcript_45579/g.84474  ORF Transcript_45579/g.84474 Transcript_45579/m.84474 type:complete len:1077 (-) Transcript_45579:158-3388(-)
MDHFITTSSHQRHRPSFTAAAIHSRVLPTNNKSSAAVVRPSLSRGYSAPLTNSSLYSSSSPRSVVLPTAGTNKGSAVVRPSLSRGYSTPLKNSLSSSSSSSSSSSASSSSPRSVAAKVTWTTAHAMPQVQPQQTAPPPRAAAKVEPQNPFDQLFPNDAATPASSAASPHPLQKRPPPRTIARSASFEPIVAPAPSGGGGGGVERKNPFDELGSGDGPSSATSSAPPRPGGHRATQSLCLPSEFSASAPPPLPGGGRAQQVWGAPTSSSASVSNPVTPVSSANSAPMNAEAAAALKDLAASLSTVKPRALTEEEKAEEAKMLARMSLGEEPKESTGTKKTHHPKHRRRDSLNRHVKGVFKDSMNLVRDPVGSLRDLKQKGGGHRRGPSGSLDAKTMDGIMNEINDSGGGTKMKESKSGGKLSSLVAPLTPKKKKGKEKGGGSRLASLSPKPSFRKASLSPKPSSTNATPLQSPAPTKSGASSAANTPGSVASSSKGGKNDGLGDADSPVERNKLSPIFSSRFGGLGDSVRGLSARALATTAPPPPLGVPDLSSSSSPVPSNNSGGGGGGSGAVPSLSLLASNPGLAHKLALAPSAPAFASACSYEASSVVPAMRSSETDPVPHQTEIVPADVFLVHARTCAVMDSYRVVDQNFDFGTLVGRSRMGLEGFVDRPVVMGSSHGSSGSGSGSNDDDEEDRSDVMAANGAVSGGVLVEAAHRPIVSSVLGTADDMVVEGFFHELGGAGENREKNNSDHGPSDKKKTEDDTGIGRDKAADDRVEASVFYTNRRRQFVVTWRGTSADQAKPVRNRHVKAWKDKWENRTKGKGAFNLMSPDGEDCTVFPPYLDAYLDSGLEDRVFRLLDDLSGRQHFCDVVMTGHSFGAALAVLAAVRYASARPMMRVLCHVFGCPKVGDGPFRHWVNSLPNLRVLRVEYGGDPWVHSPEGGPWTHVGHTLAVDAGAVASAAKGSSSGDGKTDRTSSSRGGLHGSNSNGGVSDKSLPVRAYKFDKHRPGGEGSDGAGWLHHGSGKEKAKDHDLRAYVGALETISSMGLYWPSEYVGEDVGKGVKGSGKEKRLVV